MTGSVSQAWVDLLADVLRHAGRGTGCLRTDQAS